jgi:hypothetical protein
MVICGSYNSTLNLTLIDALSRYVACVFSGHLGLAALAKQPGLAYTIWYIKSPDEMSGGNLVWTPRCLLPERQDVVEVARLSTTKVRRI